MPKNVLGQSYETFKLVSFPAWPVTKISNWANMKSFDIIGKSIRDQKHKETHAWKKTCPKLRGLKVGVVPRVSHYFRVMVLSHQYHSDKKWQINTAKKPSFKTAYQGLKFVFAYLKSGI